MESASPAYSVPLGASAIMNLQFKMQIPFEIPGKMASALQARERELSRTAPKPVGVEASRRQPAAGDRPRRMAGFGTR